MVKPLNATQLTVHWHDNSLPVYSVDFQPNRNGEKSKRLATGGGDSNIRIWELSFNESQTEVVSVEYLSTLTKHTQAVNCVRFDPSGKLLASASDDGTIMIWKLSDKIIKEFGSNEDDADIKESWYLKNTFRSNTTSEVYDLAWSPDSKYICGGSMDNVIRIFSIDTGVQVTQVAEHNHYVQGVTWDPRNEFIATQSADRSVHVYKISHQQGLDDNSEMPFTLSPTTFYKITRAELPTTRLSTMPTAFTSTSASLYNHPSSASSLPTPTPPAPISTTSTGTSTSSNSQLASAKGSTPTSEPILYTPVATQVSNVSSSMGTMVPPSQASTVHRLTSENLQKREQMCISPPTSIPSTPLSSTAMNPPIGSVHKRRLSTSSTGSNTTTHSISIPRSLSPLPTVRVMEPPPSIIYKNFSLYHNETLQSFFRRLTFSPDGLLLLTTSGIYKDGVDDEISNTVYIHTRVGLNRPPIAHLPGLKKPAIAIRFSKVIYKLMDLPPTPENRPIFKLNYRMLFAVATQDSVVIYDTQRLKPLGIASNIHYAIITDICWSSDGKTIMISSADGFVSSLVVDESILGTVETYDIYKFLISHPITSLKRAITPSASASAANSVHSSPKSTHLDLSLTPSSSTGLTSNTIASSMSASVSSSNSIIELLQNDNKNTQVEVIDIIEGDNDYQDNTTVAPKQMTPSPSVTSVSGNRSVLSMLSSSSSSSSDKKSHKEEKKKRRVAPTLVTTKPPSGN
ncbi:hypothetical protein B5S31_g375 [[Candida] boidinii]|nr:hypothetical protein B5S29_g3134 [[Candida] boidinii]OWB70696.1 hypothetical protein B5S31_g375 [[Candida] boidinii]